MCFVAHSRNSGKVRQSAVCRKMPLVQPSLYFYFCGEPALREVSINAFDDELSEPALLLAAEPWQLRFRSRQRPGHHPLRCFWKFQEFREGLGFLRSDRIFGQENFV